jgi:hypothetical protein
MKKILIGIICLCFFQPIRSQIIQHQISDDSFAHVPLQFGFPYYGRIFTDSYMFSNGVVGFGSVNNHWCCTGFDLANSRGYQFDFSIMPLQTDLINYGSGRFLTEGTPQYQRYKWENISEYGVPNNLNTFGLEIRPSGFIGMYYESVNISPWRPVTIGRTGDTSQGEFYQYFHGNGFSQANFSYVTQTTGDLCLVNPLSSPQCPNYAQAYQDQQCSLNPLYSPVCGGYEVAYFNQQCSLNALYNSQCQGYAEAYALANIVTPTAVSTTVPQVQVSTTGAVSVETPIVADPVVNEVITRPQVTNAPVQTSTSSPASVTTQAEPKQEKKAETKQVATVKKVEVKNEVSAEAPKIVAPVHEYKAPIILDLAYMQMVKKPIKDNNRAMYNLIMNSQHKHEEMVDEQYRR